MIALQNEVKKPFGHVFLGLRALNPMSSDADGNPDKVCEERLAIDQRVYPHLRKGFAYPWWAWCQDCETTLWDNQFTARMMIDAEDGDISQDPEVVSVINNLYQICFHMEHLTGE